MNPKFLVPFAAVLAFGCGREQHPQTEKPAEIQKSAVTAVESPGTITGKAFLEGSPPTMPELRMDADRKCAAMHEHPVRSQQVVLGSNGSLQNVFIYIKQGTEGLAFPTPTDSVVLDQEGCTYKPRVIGMQTGQPLLIVNSDPTLHNIHAIPQVNRGFNIAQPRRGMKTERTFTRPEVMIRVKCDVHPWMVSYIGVLNHPYFGVTDLDGSVTLQNIPPGEYVIAAWHERYGEQEQRITIGAAEQKSIEFRFRESL